MGLAQEKGNRRFTFADALVISAAVSLTLSGQIVVFADDPNASGSSSGAAGSTLVRDRKTKRR